MKIELWQNAPYCTAPTPNTNYAWYTNVIIWSPYFNSGLLCVVLQASINLRNRTPCVRAETIDSNISQGTKIFSVSQEENKWPWCYRMQDCSTGQAVQDSRNSELQSLKYQLVASFPGKEWQICSRFGPTRNSCAKLSQANVPQIPCYNSLPFPCRENSGQKG